MKCKKSVLKIDQKQCTKSNKNEAKIIPEKNTTKMGKNLVRVQELIGWKKMLMGKNIFRKYGRGTFNM